MSATGKSFTFKGVDYGGSTYNLYAYIKSLPRMPQPRVNIAQLAQSDGSVTQGSTFESIRISVECAVVGTSPSDTDTKMDATVAALMQTQAGPGALIFDAFPTREYTARIVSPLTGGLALTGEKFTLEFIVPSGWHQAITATSTGDTAVNSSGVTTI